MITERIRNLPAPVRLLLGILLGALGSRIMQEVFEDQADTLDAQHAELAELDTAITARHATVEHLDGLIRIRNERLDRLPQVQLPEDIVDAEIISDVQDLPQAAR